MQEGQFPMYLFQGVSMTVRNFVQTITCSHVVCSKSEGGGGQSKIGFNYAWSLSGLLTFVCLLQGFSPNFASRICIDFPELLKVVANDAWNEKSFFIFCTDCQQTVLCNRCWAAPWYQVYLDTQKLLNLMVMGVSHLDISLTPFAWWFQKKCNLLLGQLLSLKAVAPTII